MLAEFPLFYRVKGLGPRERNVRSHECLDFVTINIKEVDEDEAPFGIALHDGEAAENLRHFDGKWWAKDSTDGEALAHLRVKTGLCASDREPYLVSGGLHSVLRHTAHRLASVCSRIPKGMESLNLREIIQDDKQRELDQLSQDVEASVIAIGGELYTRVSEPFLSFTVDDGQDASVGAVFGLPEHGGMKNRTFVLAADRAEELEALVADYEALTEKRADRVAGGTYLHGQLSQLSREGQDLFHAAEACVSHATYSIHRWRKEEIVAWIGLRDAVQSAEARSKAEGKLDDGDVDSIRDALAEYELRTPVPPFAHLAAERWRYRTILAADLGLPAP